MTTDESGQHRRVADLKEERRRDRLAAYQRLVAERPHLFTNPAGAAYEILLDTADQEFVADQSAADNKRRDLPEEDADIGVVYSDRFIVLLRDAVRFRSGRRGAYIRLCGAKDGVGAAVLPLLSDGRVVLIRHFRHADRSWHWEIPRGFAEGSDDGSDTARRELAEELGCRVERIDRLGAVNGDSGLRATTDDVYLAHIPASAFEVAIAEHAAEEGIDEVRPVSPDVLRKMIKSGEITDGFTLAAYAFATAAGALP
ncbi:NUDIX hydrolase [Kitasatospora sp. NPDC050543]|uniref:NUDIX hydrolase n=1 Tax=Kitasatospora sp. NPDC050543 TaxID=3364054 RepID=UPI0037AE2002